MANYEKRENGTWSVRFRIKDIYGNVINKRLSGYAKKSQAEEAYRNFMKTYVEPRKIVTVENAYNMTFAKLYDKYLKFCSTELKESSYIGFRNVADKHILPYFKNKIVGKISELDILTWKQELSAKTFKKNGKEVKYSFGMKKITYALLVHILNYAKKYYSLEVNNAVKVGNFKDKHAIKKEMLFWNLQEFNQFINYVDDDIYRVIFETLYYTGMRKGELRALKWTDIDFEKNIIKISKNISRTEKPNNDYKITSTKSKNGNRKITMPNILNQSLFLFKKSKINSNQYNDDYFIFGNADPIPEHYITYYMNYYIEKSGVKKIRVHDLRHSHVSLLISTGGQSLSLVYVIAKRIGDAPEQIFKTYGHLFPDDEKMVLDNLNKCIDKNILYPNETQMQKILA